MNKFFTFTLAFLILGCPKKESETEIIEPREPIFIDIDDDDLDDLPEAEDEEN
tara:strand:- start:363 stop:521 length:159 start_codon:yes stop_codon:yes gene_type:complete